VKREERSRKRKRAIREDKNRELEICRLRAAQNKGMHEINQMHHV